MEQQLSVLSFSLELEYVPRHSIRDPTWSPGWRSPTTLEGVTSPSQKRPQRIAKNTYRYITYYVRQYVSGCSARNGMETTRSSNRRHISSEQVPSGKPTWQWKNGPFEDVFPIEKGMFHCHVSLPECTCSIAMLDLHPRNPWRLYRGGVSKWGFHPPRKNPIVYFDYIRYHLERIDGDRHSH